MLPDSSVGLEVPVGPGTGHVHFFHSLIWNRGLTDIESWRLGMMLSQITSSHCLKFWVFSHFIKHLQTLFGLWTIWTLTASWRVWAALKQQQFLRDPPPLLILWYGEFERYEEILGHKSNKTEVLFVSLIHWSGRQWHGYVGFVSNLFDQLDARPNPWLATDNHVCNVLPSASWLWEIPTVGCSHNIEWLECNLREACQY